MSGRKTAQKTWAGGMAADVFLETEGLLNNLKDCLLCLHARRLM